MKAVLDASAAVSIALKKAGYESIQGAISLYNQIIAPDLFRSETANTLWKYVNFEDLKYEHAVELLESILGMVDDYTPTSENNTEAFFEAVHYKHTVYDMLYLTLARRNNAALITLDKKLANLAAKLGVTIYYEKS